MTIEDFEDPFERAVRRESALQRARAYMADSDSDRKALVGLFLWLTFCLVVVWGGAVAAHWAFLPEPRWLLTLHAMLFVASTVCALATTGIVQAASVGDHDSTAPARITFVTGLAVMGVWGLVLALHWTAWPDPAWLVILHSIAFAVAAGTTVAVSGIVWAAVRHESA